MEARSQEILSFVVGKQITPEKIFQFLILDNSQKNVSNIKHKLRLAANRRYV